MEITKVHSNWDSAVASQHMAQYTSLILIILAFVVGALSKPYEGGATQIIPHSQAKSAAELKRISELKFNIFALNSSAEFRTEELEALYFLISNHDLNAEIEVYGDSLPPESNIEVGEEAGITLGVARAMTLYRRLIQMGAAPSASRVRAKDGYSSAQVVVKLVDISEEL